MVNRLVGLAEGIYTQPRQTFEAGVAQAMVAVLASPQFLFREEGVEATADAKSQPLVDEYALASRLSYFLWSSMPDDELFKQAAAGTLRKNLDAEVKRMPCWRATPLRQQMQLFQISLERMQLPAWPEAQAEEAGAIAVVAVRKLTLTIRCARPCRTKRIRISVTSCMKTAT